MILSRHDSVSCSSLQSERERFRLSSALRCPQFSLWALQPTPGEGTRPTPPQNRRLVGRVPSPGVPIWSIMRIAGWLIGLLAFLGWIMIIGWLMMTERSDQFAEPL